MLRQAKKRWRQQQRVKNDGQPHHVWPRTVTAQGQGHDDDQGADDENDGKSVSIFYSRSLQSSPSGKQSLPVPVSTLRPQSLGKSSS